ncbi:MAG: Clp protease N-terminal domain-containing protein [Micromonosporaceae bacterium]
MFERFTDQARDVVVQAQLEARQLRHNYIGAEHLFLGVLASPEAPGVAALVRLGITPERFRCQTREVVGEPNRLGPADADALQTLGIDLEEVKRRVESSFGPGALDPPRRTRRSWLPWRRGCDEPVGHVPFTPRAKQALECALRQAKDRRDRYIGVEHILLALLVDKENLAIGVLRHLGLDVDSVRIEVLADLDEAA